MFTRNYTGKEVLYGCAVLVDQLILTDVSQAIATARAEIFKELSKSADGEAYTLLQTIPGIGPYIAASILGEIQNIDRFHSSDSLVAYAGLDPKIKQSGKVLNSTGRLTKRGSSYLRRSLFIAANISRMYDPSLKAYYDKKRSEGKTHTVAVCVVARKLTRIIWSVWKNNKPYYLPEN